MEKKKIDDNQFFIRMADVIREQTLEYILWKIAQYETFKEFKEGIKKELCNLHSKNMKNMEKEINNH